MKIEHEIAIVTWVDIEDRTSPGWVPFEQALADAREPFRPVLTVGVVIYEDDERLSLTASMGPEETSGCLTIPKSVILSDDRVSVCVQQKTAMPKEEDL